MLPLLVATVTIGLAAMIAACVYATITGPQQ
jgi:hypothetical protein